MRPPFALAASGSGRIGLVLLVLLVLGLTTAPGAGAATVWDGPSMDFSKPGFADETDPANQDQIMPGVSLTRGRSMGLFNIAAEAFYGPPSPADTEWAWDLAGFNAGERISASNFANLEFNDWFTAFGGAPPQGVGPPGTVGIPGVLHIISADVYIDILFTEWGEGPGSGASFAYTRSTAPVMGVAEPGPALLLALAGLALALRGRRRSCD